MRHKLRHKTISIPSAVILIVAFLVLILMPSHHSSKQHTNTGALQLTNSSDAVPDTPTNHSDDLQGFSLTPSFSNPNSSQVGTSEPSTSQNISSSNTASSSSPENSSASQQSVTESLLPGGATSPCPEINTIDQNTYNGEYGSFNIDLEYASPSDKNSEMEEYNSDLTNDYLQMSGSLADDGCYATFSHPLF